ncbi:carbohydrate-binding domain-containing protein [Paenibacillus timonensis]|uniref:Carbohydrate-binding domain-containing protein n=2 Tax=Paenibacillus timonensis TaxID=225915 RepID=A0ABW3SD96_9BACL|nr:carbohydrate-binding domain-containing protein [Paenibacillus timonensis]MCH1641349.1 carbohydrate-binding domain-containing protein [Paenibacillus timonensis]
MNKWSTWNTWGMGSKLGIIMLCTAMMTACGAASATEDQTKETGAAAELTSAGSGTELVDITVADLVTFKDRDTKTDWSADTSTAIMLNGNTATVNGSGAKVSGGTVTIDAAGTYVLSGKLSDGQIIVDAAEDSDVQLVLNEAEIHDNDSAPIYVKAAGNVILTLQEGTENTVSDGQSYAVTEAETDAPNAAIFSKADLTINGAGSLTVTGNSNNGINSKDDLKIVGGMIKVEAVDDGILGKDMVAVKDGQITVKAGGDGIKSSNDTDDGKGFVAIAGGTFNVTAGTDGIQAATQLVVDGGTFGIVTGGGSANGEVKVQDNGRGGGQWGKPGGMNPGDAGQPAGSKPSSEADATSGASEVAGMMEEPAQTSAAMNVAADGSANTEAESTDTESDSKKGLKASGEIVLNNGSFTLDSADDAVHGNTNVSVKDGKFKVASGDDGFHADATLAIAGGTIDITKSYEGIEGGAITVSGGETRLIATDDGVNVSGGNDASGSQDEFAASAGNILTISGGYLYVDAAGDGLDSNGSIVMTGGTALVNGPTNSGNGPLDYNGSYEMTGGILVAAGSSGMAQAPSDTSSQYSVAMTFPETQQAGTLVHLEDNAGNEILTFAPTKNYQSIVISSPDLKKGSYVLYTGGSSAGSATDGMYTDGQYTGGTKVVSFEITDSITTWLNESGVTTGNAGFGPGGGGRGGRGMGPQGERPTDQATAPADQAPTAPSSTDGL